MVDTNRESEGFTQSIAKRLPSRMRTLWLGILVMITGVPVFIGWLASVGDAVQVMGLAGEVVDSVVQSIPSFEQSAVGLLTGLLGAIVAAATAALCGSKIRDKEREVRDLENRLAVAIRYERVDRGRWGDFERLTFGHLAYPPLLEYRDGDPGGPGLDFLRKLLDPPVQLTAFEERSNWNTFARALDERKFDVLATPVFATFERSRRVDFSSPLFFSNVGLFVNRKRAQQFNLQNLSLADLKKFFQDVHAMSLVGIAGEISEKLANKFGTDGRISIRGGEYLVSSVFQDVANNENSAVFCESFFASRQAEVARCSVVNILKPGELIYPVCYAVRLGDYQLANLLNIRLLELASNGAILDKLAETVGEGSTRDHFFERWPCS
jgi:hypothetical protein